MFQWAEAGRAPRTQPINSWAPKTVGRAFTCGEKLLGFVPPAEIQFSKEIRRRYCCYSNSQSHLHTASSPQPHSWPAISVTHREWPRLSPGGPFLCPLRSGSLDRSSMSNLKLKDQILMPHRDFPSPESRRAEKLREKPLPLMFSSLG